jgi:hypothetical protein
MFPCDMVFPEDDTTRGSHSLGIGNRTGRYSRGWPIFPSHGQCFCDEQCEFDVVELISTMVYSYSTCFVALLVTVETKTRRKLADLQRQLLNYR